jgi:toxin ParE1/3/4
VVRKVVWTESAWNDVEEISAFISRDSMFYARACIEEIRDAAGSLAMFSEEGRAAPECGDNSVREIFVRNFRLIYLLSGHVLYIAGFIHGSRDLWQLWDDNRNISS